MGTVNRLSGRIRTTTATSEFEREIVHHVCSITDDFCYLLNSELVCNWYVNSIHCAVEDASIDNYAG